VTDLALTMFKASNGYVLAFGDTGKIYAKVAGTWVLKYTDPDGKITGACEFKSTSDTYILYATQTKLKKIILDAFLGALTIADVTTVGTFTNGNSNDFHTMRNAIGVVIVCDGDLNAMYDYNDAFNPAALRMPSGTLAKALLDRNDRIINGTKMSGLSEGYFITWDRKADSWNDKKSAQGDGVNGMGFLESGVVAQVGSNGKLKYWNFGETSPLTVIPKTGTTYPGGVVTHNTMPHFAMNGGTRNGVYSIGRIDLNNPRALNLEYVPSHGKLTGTEIGAIASDGDDLYVAWKDGTTYGIDVTDQNNKALGVYESLELNMTKSGIEKLFRTIKPLLAEPLPAGCSVVVKYRATRTNSKETAVADAEGWVQVDQLDGETTINRTGAMKGNFGLEGQGEKLEMRIELHPNGNTSPEIDSLHIGFSFMDKL